MEQMSKPTTSHAGEAIAVNDPVRHAEPIGQLQRSF